MPLTIMIIGDSVASFIFIFKSFPFKARFTWPRWRTTCLLCLLQIVGLTAIACFFQSFPPLLYIVSPLIILILSAVFLRGSVIVKLAGLLLLTQFIILTTSVLNYVFSYSPALSPDLAGTILQYAVRTGTVILLAVFLPFYHFSSTPNIHRRYWIILVVEIVSCMLFQFFQEPFPMDSRVGLLSILILFSLLLMHCLFMWLMKEYEQNYQNKLSVTQLSTQKKHLEETVQMSERIILLKHELKNQIFYMNNMLKQKNYEELEQYFQKKYQQEYAIDMVDYGDDFLSALLNQKALYAKSKQIPLLITAESLQSCTIDMGDFCTLLSNIIDNAIEACTTLENPRIELELKKVKNYIIVLCKNTITDDVLKNNPELKSIKNNDEPHGIGLRMVRDIVNKYEGVLDFKVEEKMFIVELMLKNRN